MTNELTPPSSGPGRPKDPAKRAAILEAAQRLFLRHGYEGSSMEAIAAEAGVSKLTLYSHFAGKEHLYAAAVGAKCREGLPPLLFQRQGPLEESLMELGRRFLKLINSPESLAMHRLMIAQAAHNPALSQLFFEAGPAQVIAGTAQLLQQAVDEGELALRDPQLAAEQLLSLFRGACFLRQLVGCAEEQTEAEQERQVGAAVQLFLRAYRTP